MSPNAKVIADSISPAGKRLTTMEVVMHRFVLAEFNTHRAFSRNSASSRAIPYAKQRERVLNDPAIPLSWPAEQKGMQGGEEIEDTYVARGWWLRARGEVVDTADNLHALGVHKSVVNRLLEPFMWHTVVVTATEWDGFFDQRCSPLAQPEIWAAATAMRDALDDSTPTPLNYGGWHLPYVGPEDLVHDLTHDLRHVSAARCARVSYLTQDGRRDPEADVALYERLRGAQPPHWSPLEHVARPADEGYHSPEDPYLQRNLIGWVQLRTLEEQR